MSHSASLSTLLSFWQQGHSIRGLPVPSKLPQNTQGLQALKTAFQNQYTPPQHPPFPLDIGPIQVGLPHFDQLFPSAISWEHGKVAVCVTHDVDLFDGLSYFPLRFAGWAKTIYSTWSNDPQHCKRTIKRAKQWLPLWWKNEDPIAHFQPWLDLSQKYEFTSSYFFLSVEKALSKEGRLYTFSDPRVQSLLADLRAAHQEIGLHANRFESTDLQGLLRQKERLEKASGQAVHHIRHHCLTLPFPTGWYDLIQAGFTLSSNLGHHPPHQGYLNGSAWPFPIWSPSSSSPSSQLPSCLWECPMAIMDVAYGPAASRLWASTVHLLKTLKHRGGVLVLNFHPHYRVECEAPGVHRQYLKILEDLCRGRDEGWLDILSLKQIEEKLNQRLSYFLSDSLL